MKKYVVSFVLSLWVCYAYSQTLVSGGVYSNTTWSAAGNPYIVTGNVVVFEGVTLTISPGVIVKFNAEAGIELRGRLRAIGEENDSITFTSNLAAPGIGSWRGIKVIGTSAPIDDQGQVTMEFCIGKFAYYFIDLDAAYLGPYVFKHCHFTNNHKVNYDGGQPITLFENCKFESNNTALGSCQFDSKVSNSLFINNVNGIDRIANVDTCYFFGNTGIALSPGGSTVGCTIQNNYIGVSGSFNSVNNYFVYNNVSNNDVGVEIMAYFNGSVTFTRNKICNNRVNNIKLVNTQNADLSNNCWCSEDSSFIRSTIGDGYVDASNGLVNFMPISTECSVVNTGVNQSVNTRDESVAMFPNPFGNSVQIYNETKGGIEISLFDITGRMLINLIVDNNHVLDTESLPKGIYCFQIKNSSGLIKSGRLIKD